MLSLNFTFGSLPRPFNHDDLVTFVTTISGNITGDVSNDDIGDGAVTPAKASPGAYFYAAGTLGGGIYVVTLSPAMTAYEAGASFAFKASAANAGAVNVNVNGLGSIDLLLPNGAELPADYIPAGSIVEVRLQSATVAQVTSVQGKPFRVRCTDTGTANAIILAVSPTSTLALADLIGVELEWTVVNTNTATPVTLQVNALTAKNLVRRGGAPLEVGDLIAGDVVRAMHDGTNFQLLTPPGAAVVDTAIIGAGRNIVMKNGSPSASRMTLTADELILKTSTGASIYLATNVSVYADIGASGAGGLDTGGEANSTHYYLWAIYNPATGTVNALISLSATAPTMPSGYTFKCLVGSFYNDSVGDFLDTHQIDRECHIEAVSVFNTNSPTVNTALSLVTAIPPIARTVRGIIGTTGATVMRAVIFPDPVLTIGAQDFMGSNVAAGPNGFTCSGNFNVLIRTASTIYWQTSAAQAYQIYITGYTI